MEWAIVVLIAVLVFSSEDEGKGKIDICVGNCPITVCKEKTK